MSQPKFTFFEQAIKAGRRYVQTSVRARDAQYHFLALVYLAHKEGQDHPQEFESLIQSRLKRQPNKHETNRPFLLLLHALLGREDDLPRNAIKQFSKLTSALEEFARAFHDSNPNTGVIVVFIEDAGGVAGLYDLSRIGNTNGDNHSQSESQKIVDLKPNEIALSVMGVRVTKVGCEYKLRLTERDPGEYLVRLRVGRGGFVESILDEDMIDENAA